MMNAFGLTFHHHGLALKKEDSAIPFLTGLGYHIGDLVHDPEQKVHLRLCTHDEFPCVELVSKADEDGPLDTILKKTTELIYHTCYETADLTATLQTFEGAGLRALPVVERKPAILFGGRYVSFYHVMGFGLIELLEK